MITCTVGANHIKRSAITLQAHIFHHAVQYILFLHSYEAEASLNMIQLTVDIFGVV